MTTTSTKTKPISLRTVDGRLVGVLKGNIFNKSVRESKHLFRSVGSTGAWGIDYDILFNKLPESCVVKIKDIETRTRYQIAASVWRESGVIMHFKKNTRDQYVQVFLPRTAFAVSC